MGDHAESFVQINKNLFNSIRVELKTYKGKEFLDLRQYYLDDIKDIWSPTAKGITIPPEKISELIDALEKFKK